MRELQRAAARLAEVHPELVRSWLRRAGKAALMPSLRVRVGRGLVELTRDSVTTPVYSMTDDWSIDVEATWQLDRLVFDRNELRASREAQRLAGHREELLTRVAQLYYARRRLQVDALLQPDAPAAVDRALEIRGADGGARRPHRQRAHQGEPKPMTKEQRQHPRYAIELDAEVLVGWHLGRRPHARHLTRRILHDGARLGARRCQLRGQAGAGLLRDRVLRASDAAGDDRVVHADERRLPDRREVRAARRAEPWRTSICSSSSSTAAKSRTTRPTKTRRSKPI